jgi:hypothetical protein
MMQNEFNRTFSILSVDDQGNFFTFDPELLSIASDRYGTFNLGNLKTHSLEESTRTDSFQRQPQDMTQGEETCRMAANTLICTEVGKEATSFGSRAPWPPVKPTPADLAPKSP